MKRPPKDQPPFTQIVLGVAELVGKLALLRPLLNAMGIRQLVEKVCPMEREHPDGVIHGQVVEVLLANRLVAPRPLSKITEWADGSGERRRYRRCYSIEYSPGAEANSVEGLGLSFNLQEVERLQALDGRYFIITTLPKETHDASTILDYYKKRDISEQAMRILKRDLKVRPVFLQKDNRVAALAFLTVFALMVFTLLTALAKRLGLGRTARHVFDLFWTVVFVRLRQVNGQWLETFLNLSEAQVRVFQALGIPLASPP